MENQDMDTDTDINMDIKTPSPVQQQNHNPRTTKMKALQNSIASLESQLESTKAELDSITPKLRDDPTTTVKKHIHLLHTYNETKDIALGLMGLLAESRGERIGTVMKGFGVSDKD